MWKVPSKNSEKCQLAWQKSAAKAYLGSQRTLTTSRTLESAFCQKVTVFRRQTIRDSKIQFTGLAVKKSQTSLLRTKWEKRFPALSTLNRKIRCGNSATNASIPCFKRTRAKNSTGLLTNSRKKLGWMAMKFPNLKLSRNFCSRELAGDLSRLVAFWLRENS